MRRSRKKEKKKKLQTKPGMNEKVNFSSPFFLPFWIFFFFGWVIVLKMWVSLVCIFFPYCATTKNGVTGRGQPKENETYH
jgi:hypothetical protein